MTIPPKAAFLRRFLVAVACAAVLGPAMALTVRESNDAGIEELLRSARLWQALERPDAEAAVLKKLLAVQSDEPRALLLLGELQVRAGALDEARRTLRLLETVRSGGFGAREMRELLRVATTEKARLAELRQFVRGGNQARALPLARALFPGGRPPADLANEFAPVLASTPGGWKVLRALFEERIRADPNPADRLSLYELLAQHADTRPEALRGFADLARGHDVAPERLARAWRQALYALADDDAGLAERRRFLGRFPADTEMRGEVARAEEARIAAQQLADDPGVQARLAAERALDSGDLALAEAQLVRSLELRPDDPETVGTRGLLRMRQGRDDEALQDFEAAASAEHAQPAHSARWRDLSSTAHYWAALRRARTLRDAGNLEAAAELVETVRATQPDQTEAAQVLAGIRAAQGRAPEAERLYRELLARDGSDARAWRGLLALRLQEGKVDEAFDEALELPLRANVAVADALDAGAVRDAIARVALGHPDTQLRLLERAVQLLPREAWLRYDLARRYLELRLPDLAREVMHEGADLAPEDAAMRYARALVDAAADHEDEALAGVESIPAPEQTDGMRALAQRLRFERDLRLARAARTAGDAAGDAKWREQALEDAGDDPARRLRVARADLAAGDSAGARALLNPLGSAQQSLEPEDRRGLAGALIDAGETDAAQAQIARMATATPAPDAGSAADLALLQARVHTAQHDPEALLHDWLDLRGMLAPDEVPRHLEAIRLMDRDRATAQQWMDELLARHPDDPEVLLEAARQARRDGQYAKAVELLRRIAALAPAPEAAAAGPIPLLAPRDGGAAQAALPDLAAVGALSVQARAQEQLDQIEARRQPHVDTGWLGYARSADDGISTLRGTEIPILAVWPQDYDGHWFGQLDSVHLDAGTLPAPISGSAQFGKVLALAPAGLAQPVAEGADGISLAAGWRGDQRRFDVGVVGIGFPVSNLVGGWRESRTWGDTDVSADLSRRVVTGSMLSYSGAHDPVTGEAWGGVTHTSLVLRAGRDFAGGWSGSTSLLLGELSGRSVPSNFDVQSRTVFERDWVHRPDFRLSAGGLLSLWHYESNDSFYTFGQGGYYSPQRYVSIGIPIEASGRRGMLSYDVRATPSHSWTYEQNTPYYPADGGLQVLAGNPVHTAGPGGGLAGSLRADVEYRAAAHWTFGAWLDIDRSAYYAPTRAMLYVRYWLKPQSGLVDFPPRPVVPISLY